MKSSLLALALCVAATGLACSSTPAEETPTPVGTGGTPGSGGAAVGTGGAVGSGGAAAPEVAPPAPEDAGTTPEVPAPAVDMRPDLPATPPGGGLTSKDFTCSWILGITTTGEWYRAGFERVVDDARWQVTPIEMGHLEKWADPQNGIWRSGIDSPCAQNSRTPDRIVFNATKYEWTTMAEFLPAYVAVVNNIKTKYPSVKRIDLMTYGRAPGNVQCANANRPTYSYIKKVQDDAAAMMPAMFPGFVFVAPKWEHKSCGDFGLCPHVNGAANAALAKTTGEYFLAN